MISVSWHFKVYIYRRITNDDFVTLPLRRTWWTCVRGMSIR